jgi:hypothetical protein
VDAYWLLTSNHNEPTVICHNGKVTNSLQPTEILTSMKESLQKQWPSRVEHVLNYSVYQGKTKKGGKKLSL